MRLNAVVGCGACLDILFWRSMQMMAKRRGAISRGRIDLTQTSSLVLRRGIVLCLLLLFPLVAAFRAHGRQAEHSSKPPASVPSPTQESIRFEDIIEKSGIKFQLKNSVSPQRFSIETMLGGVA